MLFSTATSPWSGARRAGGGLRHPRAMWCRRRSCRAYLGLHELSNPGRFASWLRVISRRVCMTEARARERTVPMEGHPAPTASGATGHGELRQLLSCLGPDDREPLHLHYVLGLDTESAAKAMGLTSGAFRVRLHRARRRARALARSQQVEERMIMTGQNRSQLARQLFEEAREATYIFPGSVEDSARRSAGSWSRPTRPIRTRTISPGIWVASSPAMASTERRSGSSSRCGIAPRIHGRAPPSPGVSTTWAAERRPSTCMRGWPRSHS